MKSLREYSYAKVGDIWTELDHIHLMGQLDQIDKLAQAVHNLRTITDARKSGSREVLVSRS